MRQDYRATRRNSVKNSHLVWGTASYSSRHVTLPRCVKAQPKGSSAYISNDGVRRPEVRMTRRTYKPNGVREMARRVRQLAA
jgi:hypothetical protein